MKSFLFIVFFIHSAFSYEYSVKPKEISPDIHCFFGVSEVMNKHNNGNISNSCYVDLGTSYLVIDTGPSYNYARDTYKAMQKIKEQKVSHVIITHIHDDHWLGNGFYEDMGATIIGPKIFANTPKEKTTRMQRRILPEAYEGTRQVYPSELIDDTKSLVINETGIKLKAYNYKNHSVNDLIVSIPNKNVVFVGDLVFNDRILSLRDGDINNWIKTLEEIDSKDITYIVGGHGELHTKEATKTTLEYLRDVKRLVLDSIDEGLGISETLENSDLPKYKDIKTYEIMHRGNVEKAYRTLEWADE